MMFLDFLVTIYGTLFMMMVLHRVIYGEFASLKWEYFIPIFGILFFLNDNF
jgi:hypothetical protein